MFSYLWPGELTPPITRAIHFYGVIQSGAAADYVEQARLWNVTRAKVTQMINQLMLAPEIQEDVLFLSQIVNRLDPVMSRDLQGGGENTHLEETAGVVKSWSTHERHGHGLIEDQTELFTNLPD